MNVAGAFLHGVACDFAGVIDPEAKEKMHGRVLRNKRIEVPHLSVLPQVGAAVGRGLCR